MPRPRQARKWDLVVQSCVVCTAEISTCHDTKRSQAEITRPVRPRDKLGTEIRRMGEQKSGEGREKVRFVTKVKGGKVCLGVVRA